MAALDLNTVPSLSRPSSAFSLLWDTSCWFGGYSLGACLFVIHLMGTAFP